MDKKCIACGMPMVDVADFAMEVSSNDYCRHCARPDGSMQSFDEKLSSLSSFIIKTQGLAESVAQKTAKSMMMKLPAWNNKE